MIPTAKLIMAQLEGKSSKDSKTESNIGCTTHQGETLEGLKNIMVTYQRQSIQNLVVMHMHLDNVLGGFITDV